jgi:uncharacterized protein YkwD
LLLSLLRLTAALAAETDQLRPHTLTLVRRDRTWRGLGALQFSGDLNEAAHPHANEMLQRSYYAHASPEGDTVQDRYIDAGGSRWQLVAEDIARCIGCEAPATPDRVAQLHQGWMDRPGHRENVLRRDLDCFGLGLIPPRAPVPRSALRRLVSP